MIGPCQELFRKNPRKTMWFFAKSKKALTRVRESQTSDFPASAFLSKTTNRKCHAFS